jgi:hypothetical protein
VSAHAIGSKGAPLLSVERLSATLHLSADYPAGAADEVSRLMTRLQSGLAGPSLAAALGTTDLPAGRWFLRRVDVPVILDLTRSEPGLVHSWAADLAGAVRRLVLAGGPQVAHYPDDAALIADAVQGIVTGRLAAAWAWAAAGVLVPGDPEPASRPGDLLVVLAVRMPPELLTAVLAMARRPGGIAALDRVLGATGWTRLVAALAGAAGIDGRALLEPTDDQRGGVAARPAPRGGPLPESIPDPVRAGSAKARSIAAGSVLVGRIRASRLRPGPEVLAAWALLVVLDADPGSLPSAGSAALLAALTAELEHPADPGRPETVRSSRTTADEGPEPGSGAASTGSGVDPAPGVAGKPVAGVAGEAVTDVTENPVADVTGDRVADLDRHRETEPDGDCAGEAGADRGPDTLEADLRDSRPTTWAGLPFLLATASAIGLPAVVLDDPALADRPLRWVLYVIGGLLVPAADDDPARLVLAGLPPDPAGVPFGPPPTERETDAMARLAAAWAASIADRLAAAGDPSPDPEAAVIRVTHRPGTVIGSPGWLEVRLPLATVDLTIRRAGLDIDPGWLSWLGAVVRYVYA